MSSNTETVSLLSQTSHPIELPVVNKGTGAHGDAGPQGFALLFVQ